MDDEADVLRLTWIMLDSEGYEVDTASSGEDALRMVSERRPDLVLLDVVMPGMSGLEVCRELKRDEGTRGIPVIMFTALGPEVDVMLGRGEKADDYVLKPFSRRLLLDKVARHLGQ